MNHLQYETSPYLLQHARNPVHWYPWGKEALERAVKEDKPILVSIGYAACHWCHVMEHESFEDAETAALMNEHFINIKIDREERPDLDHIYMDAVQTIAGNGGWPLNVFLTPDKKPFYGGTYYPPKPFANRPSWKEVLTAVAAAFKNKRAAIEQQAEELTQHLSAANSFGLNTDAANLFVKEDIDAACINILKQADTAWGGFGRAPKFPQIQIIRFLLRYYNLEYKRSESNAEVALKQALLSLDKMIEGGIYDQLGGGLARYATDTEWLVPHFEKMLYDNALFVSVLAEAYQLTGYARYKNCITEVLRFAGRELLDASGGFYAALDADSEGVEGKYYVWSKKEVTEILGEMAPAFCEYYDISDEGNWEGTNILRVLKPLEEVAAGLNCTTMQLQRILDEGRALLLAARQARVKPALDDKIILGWNALMNTAYSKAFEATGDPVYKDRAIANMEFLLKSFIRADGGCYHVWKNEVPKFPGFLDDYAYLIEALLQLHRITANTYWLLRAKTICEKVQADFAEHDTGYFFYTPQQQEDVILRKKEVYDGATPSGNAVMAKNLLELAVFFDLPDWRLQAENMVRQLTGAMVRYPASFGAWMLNYYSIYTGIKEIVLSGGYESIYTELLHKFLPGSVIMASGTVSDQFPLLRGKEPGTPLNIYLCENYSCKRPVQTLKALLDQLN